MGITEGISMGADDKISQNQDPAAEEQNNQDQTASVEDAFFTSEPGQAEQVDTEAQAQPQSESEPQQESGQEPQEQVQPQPEPEPQQESSKEPQQQAQPQPEPQQESGKEPQQQAQPQSDPEPQQEPGQEPSSLNVTLLDGADPFDKALPMAGGPGSQPAPFDPQRAPTWQALLAEYNRELAAMGEVPAAAALHYESGRIWEEKLAQPRNAWQSYNHAFQLHPGLIPNIRSARRLASQVGNWNVSLQIIDSELEATDDPEIKAHLLHTKGLILEEKLGKQAEARATYESALQFAPNNVELLKQMERLAITTSDWRWVLEIRAKLLTLTKAPETIVELLLSSARLLQLHFDDDGQALDLYKRVLQLQPENRLALRAIRTIHEKTKRWDDLIQTLFTEAQVNSEPSLVANLYYQAARIFREQLNDSEHALEALKRALGLSPNDHMILNEMAQLYEGLMQWQELVDVYERQVQIIADRQELVSLYFKLGNIWEEKLFNEDKAIPCYGKVVDLNPNYMPALQALGKLFYRKGQWDDLVKMYEIEIRETQDPKQRSTKLYKLAEILEERLSRDEDAIKKYEQCVKLNPGFLPALKALGRLYSKYKRWESLIEMYENELSVTSDHDQKIFLLDKVGSLWEEKLNNVDKAIASYQRILELAPNYLPAIRTLGKLYVRADKWEEIIRINEMESQIVNDQKQVISLLHRSGEIYEEKLNDKDKAIETYKQVLTLSPAYLPALQNLGRLYFIKGLWDELITMYRQEMEISRNESQKISLLYKIGELYEEKLVRLDDAIAAYQQVLEIQPGNFPALKALGRIYSSQRDWANLIEILEKEATAIEDPNQKTIALFRVAEIWEYQLQRPEKAIETHQYILQLLNDHALSLNALIRLYTARKEWREVLSVYERELSATTNPARQIQILFRMAEIHANEVNDLVQAADTYEKILSIEPDHLASMEALERIYLAQRNYPSLMKVYEAMAQRTTDDQLKIALHGQIADIKQNRLQPPQNAAENYLRILELDPKHSEATHALYMLYQKFGTWDGLKVLYERELSQSNIRDEALDLCMRIADIAQNYLDQPEVAIHYYSQALQINPDYLPAIKALKSLYQATDNPKGVISLLEREGQVTRDPVQAIHTLLQAAQLYRDKFSEPAKAIECFFKVLERDPKETQAFSQLESLLSEQQDHERLAVLYRNRLGVTDDSRLRIDLHMKLGKLQSQHLNSLSDASDNYREVLKINPSHVQALSALAQITFQTESWDESMQLTNRIIELSNDPEQLAIAHQRLGIIYQEKKPNLDKAIDHLTKTVELQPGNIDALLRLKMIYTARQQWAEAITMLENLSRTDPDNRMDYLMEKAKMLETGMGDTDGAMHAYRELQKMQPENTKIIQKLGELFERLEKWPELVESYQLFIQMLPPENATEALPLHMKMGSLYAQQLNNLDKAIIEYKKAINLSPNNTEAHVSLASLYGSTGLYYANAVDEHRKLLALNPFRLESYHELRRIFEEQRAFDKVFCVSSVLHFLRAADQNEEFFYGENVNKAKLESTAQLSDDEIERLLIHPDERGIVRKILKLVGSSLTKLYPPDLVKFGVGKGDKARQDDPLRKLSDGMAVNFGGLSYDVYHSTQPTKKVEIVNTSPVAMIVGDGLIKRTQNKTQRFALSQALKRIKDGSFLATLLGAKELAKLLAAIVAPHFPSSPIATYPSELPPDLPKKINKALPRKTRKALEELLKTNSTELARVPDYEAYLMGVEHSANRAGLVLCGDLANATMYLSQQIPELKDKRQDSTEQIIASLSPHPIMRELMAFAVSEEFFNLRTRLKLTIL